MPETPKLRISLEQMQQARISELAGLILNITSQQEAERITRALIEMITLEEVAARPDVESYVNYDDARRYLAELNKLRVSLGLPEVENPVNF